MRRQEKVLHVPSASLIGFLSTILLIYLVLLSSHASSTSEENPRERLVMSLGSLVDYASREGREEKVAMEMAIEDFCSNHSSKNKISLKFCI
ncbi:hypothetical protein L484_001448 [Morus notabilis]|uniref:Uncharacterized protein n=1 Tax=Morus notabilis TaxID=981085 RepID=W9RKN8_9ROSA|nr:hypothetical protein L484_001448 [Morus notabilis]